MPQYSDMIAKGVKKLREMGSPKRNKSDSKETEKPVKSRKPVKNNPIPETIAKKLKENTGDKKTEKNENSKHEDVLSKISSYFKIPGTENGIKLTNPDDKKIENKVNDLMSKFKNLGDTDMDTLKNESSILSSAQNALDEIEGEPTKEKLKKKLVKREETEEKAKSILEKIQDIGLIDKLTGSVNTDGIQNKIEKNHQEQTSHVDNEISLLEKFKKLTSSLGSNGVKGKDKEGKETLSNKILDSISEKISGKKDEKEEKRKKSWFERTFFHNNKNGHKHNTVANSEKPPKFLKKFKVDLNSASFQLYVYFSFISIVIFTITLYASYNNKKIHDSNEKLMKHTQGLYTFGMVIVIIFLVSLSLSFGHDKDFITKLGSFILLNGSIYMGGYYTYLESNGRLKKLSSSEKMASQIVVATYILFLLGSSGYVLSEKRKGKIGRIFGILYLLACFIGFFPIGGAVTSFNASLEVPSGEKESLLVRLCSIFYGLGIFLFISAMVDAIPALNKAVSKGFNNAISKIESFKIKLLIVSGLIMTIYYVYALYKVYYSKYISGDGHKFKDVRHRGVNSLIRISYLVGLALVAAIIFSFSLSFGGTLKEQAMAIFLTFFVVICGSYITYLEGEGKITTEGKEEKSYLTGTIAVFMILLVTCFIFTLLGKRSGQEILIKDSLRIGSNLGSIAIFVYLFAIVTAVAFSEFLFHNAGSSEGKYLWTGFGIGLLILVIFVGSYFI